MASPADVSPAAFEREVNSYLRHLSRLHSAALRSGDAAGVRAATRAADLARRAHAVHGATHRLFLSAGGPVRGAAAPGSRAGVAADFLQGLVPRLFGALRAREVGEVAGLVGAGEETLELLANGGDGAFEEVSGGAVEGERRIGVGGGEVEGGERDVDDVDGVPTAEEVEAARAGGVPRKRPPGRLSRARAAYGRLNGKQKFTLCLYLVMVLASLVAVGFITADYVDGLLNKEAVLRVTVEESIAAPVVTVCTSLRAIPQSRLQMFNFSDAAGTVTVGADPQGPQAERASPEFTGVVDRFFDNPDDEDCQAVVGDFFPLPLRSLNEIAAGTRSSRCRPCFRVGASGAAVRVNATSFEASSYMAMYTDSYFLQCLHLPGGLEPRRSLPFLQNAIFEARAEMATRGILSDAAGGALPQDLAAYQAITSAQACSVMYFAFFPARLGRADPTVDVRYAYDAVANVWQESGAGPYFAPPVSASSFFPPESLEMFVSTRQSTTPGVVPTSSDLALLGPNSQTFARFRPVVVYGEDRYDISVSSSNFIEDTLIPLFGYWRLYTVFYGFPRLITDEILESVAYPTEQWLVDFLGYFGMFTGLSFFSLLLVPVLHSMRKAEKRRLREERPEAFVWGRYKRQAMWRYTADDAAPDDVPETASAGVRALLP